MARNRKRPLHKRPPITNTEWELINRALNLYQGEPLLAPERERLLRLRIKVFARVAPEIKRSPNDMCGCGHPRSAHSTIEMGGSTRGVACSVDIPGETGACPCQVPLYYNLESR